MHMQQNDNHYVIVSQWPQDIFHFRVAKLRKKHVS